jgi:hypothetical protein
MKKTIKTSTTVKVVSSGSSGKNKNQAKVGELAPPDSGEMTPLPVKAKGVQLAPASVPTPTSQPAPTVSKPTVVPTPVSASVMPPMSTQSTASPSQVTPKSTTPVIAPAQTPPTSTPIVQAVKTPTPNPNSTTSTVSSPAQTQANQTVVPKPSWWWKKQNRLIAIGIFVVLAFLGSIWYFGPLLRRKSSSPPSHGTNEVKTAAVSTNNANTNAAVFQAMNLEVENLRKEIAELKSRPPTVITQKVMQAAEPIQPSSIVMTTTNTLASNSVPLRTIECKGYGGQVVGIIGNSNIVMNGPINIYPGGIASVITNRINIQQTLEQRKDQQNPIWPQGFKPTRIIQANACLLSSGVTSFSLPTETIRASEDIQVPVPDGWAIKWHCTANVDQIETAVDGRTSKDLPDGVPIPVGDKNQRHELRLRLRGSISEARLDLTFYRL